MYWRSSYCLQTYFRNPLFSSILQSEKKKLFYFEQCCAVCLWAVKLKDFAVASVKYAKVHAGPGLQIQFITRLLFPAGTFNMALPTRIAPALIGLRRALKISIYVYLLPLDFKL